MAKANNCLDIVLLDACRDNSFARSMRSASMGLAVISATPEGTFISYEAETAPSAKERQDYAMARSPARPEDNQIFTSPTLWAKFALIPAGTFTMGSPSSEPGRDIDETQHPVTISRSFYMQTTEVTQGQWKRVMGNNPSSFGGYGDDCPVEKVSWNDVQEFILKLNSMEGTDKYRLPTEAQWEYAARAGTTTRFYTGDNDDDLSRAGWHEGNSGSKTHPVGKKTPNARGLYDMHGNVWE